jgi:hypothetical protein
MSFLVSMGNSTPATTQAVFGMTSDYKQFNINLNGVNPEQQKIFEDFFVVVGGHSIVNILNSPYDFEDCSYIVVTGVDQELVYVDYVTLSNEDKEVINKFANLVTEIANL